MIKLTNTSNRAYYFNPDLITSVRKDYENPSVTVVVCDGVGDLVTETPEEVTRKILEYKLLAGKYKAYMHGAAITDDPHDEDANLTTTNLVKISILNLAGLEE